MTKQLSQSHRFGFHQLNTLVVVDGNLRCGRTKSVFKDCEMNDSIPGIGRSLQTLVHHHMDRSIVIGTKQALQISIG